MVLPHLFDKVSQQIAKSCFGAETLVSGNHFPFTCNLVYRNVKNRLTSHYERLLLPLVSQF